MLTDMYLTPTFIQIKFDIKFLSNQKGFILPSTMILGIIGMLVTLAPFTNLVNREIRLDHRITKAKARYNAESGLATYIVIFLLDSLGLDSITVEKKDFSIDYTTFREPGNEQYIKVIEI